MSLMSDNVIMECALQGLSINDFAKSANIPCSSLHYFLTERGGCNSFLMIRITASLGISEEKLKSDYYSQFSLDLKVIRRNIKKFCDLYHMTKSQLAQKSGLSWHTIHSIMNCKNQPRISTLVEIAKAFGLNVRELLKV